MEERILYFNSNKSKSNNMLFYFTIILSLLHFSHVFNAQIIILEPPELANLFNLKIEGSIAAFGTPSWDQRVTGELLYYETIGCNAADYEIEKNETTDKEEELDKIVMIKRGICNFTRKVKIAENKGAKAVIITDTEGSMSTSEDVKKILMADDGEGTNIKIPSILIGESDALRLINFLRNENKNQKVIIELAWDIPKNHAVEMKLWISPAMPNSLKFIQNFAPYAMKLKTKLDFRPHYWIIRLPINVKDMCTDDSGMFCSIDPDFGGRTTGKDVVEESVRELCLWQTTQYLNSSDPHSGFYSEIWWKYMQVFPTECPYNGKDDNHTLGEICSYNIMKNLTVNVNHVRKCYEQNFEIFLNHELLSQAWSPLAIIINDFRYTGPLDPEIVTRAVCTGYKDEQEECRKLFHPSTIEMVEEGIHIEDIYKEDFPLWAVIVISVIGGIMGLTISAVVFWKCILPAIKSNMRYVIMDEVRKEVSSYERDTLPLNNINNLRMSNSGSHSSNIIWDNGINNNGQFRESKLQNVSFNAIPQNFIIASPANSKDTQ